MFPEKQNALFASYDQNNSFGKIPGSVKDLKIEKQENSLIKCLFTTTEDDSFEAKNIDLTYTSGASLKFYNTKDENIILCLRYVISYGNTIAKENSNPTITYGDFCEKIGEYLGLELKVASYSLKN